MALLEVRDDGHGVPPEDRARVLRHFARASGARDQTGGVGLGLAIVAAIVRRHGANLHLSDAEPGLCVRIDFPPDHVRKK